MTQYILCSHAILHVFNGAGIKSCCLYDEVQKYARFAKCNIGVPIFHQTLEGFVADGTLKVDDENFIHITRFGINLRDVVERLALT